MQSAWAFGVLFIILAGCTEPTKIAEPAKKSTSNNALVPIPENLQSLDEIWANAAANEAPGFAGIVMDSDGTPEILVAVGGNDVAAAAYAKAQLIRGKVVASRSRIRHVDYDFAELRMRD